MERAQESSSENRMRNLQHSLAFQTAHLNAPQSLNKAEKALQKRQMYYDSSY